jgi:hypothetical protein
MSACVPLTTSFEGLHVALKLDTQNCENELSGVSYLIALKNGRGRYDKELLYANATHIDV